jgi:Tfp pilus assembly protein PilP
MNRIVLVVAGLGLVALIVLRQFGSKPLDPRSAIDHSITQVKSQRQISPEEEVRLRIEVAWGDYMIRNGKPPTGVSDLVPTYFDAVPTDPSTGQPFDYAATGTKTASKDKDSAPSGSSAVASVFGDGLFVNPNTMQESDFVYDPAGKRDPFMPFDFSAKNTVDMTKPPLERYSLGQLKVTAILRDTKDGGFYAFAEDATGIGYPVRKGTKIGDADGEVVRITEDAVFVVESVTDFTGKMTRTTVEMKIQRKADSDKDSAFQRVKGKGSAEKKSKR